MLHLGLVTLTCARNQKTTRVANASCVPPDTRSARLLPLSACVCAKLSQLMHLLCTPSSISVVERAVKVLPACHSWDRQIEVQRWRGVEEGKQIVRAIDSTLNK